jgi:ribonuclease-3
MLKFLKRLKKVLQPVELLKRKKEDPQKSTDEIDFEGFQKAINYKVLNKNYFINALAHRSYLKIKKNSIGTLTSNERLEFLGDAVIDLIVAEYLYKNFPFNEEGDLTKFRSILVNKKFLAERAKEINIQSYLLASFSALKSIEEYLKNLI